MPNLQITAAQMASLPGFPVQASCPAQGYVGIGVLNVSPWWWTLRDETGLTIATLSPWTYTLANVARPGTQQLTVASDTSLPEVPVNGAAAGTYVLRLELSALAVAPAVTTLANAMAANAQTTVSNTVSATISGGTVSLSAGTSVGVTGTVDVSGSVDVTNTPSVTISGTGNTVQLASGTAVGISGTVTVEGSVDIANTPAVTISGSGNTVQLAAGTAVGISGTVTVEGSVDIANSPTVNISGTGNTVRLETGTTVNIGGTATVEWTTEGPVSVTNDVIPSNDFMLLSEISYAITNWANGATAEFYGNTGTYPATIIQGTKTLAEIDGYFIVMQSSGEYGYASGGYISPSVSSLSLGSAFKYFNQSNQTFVQPAMDYSGGALGCGCIGSGPQFFDKPVAAETLNFTLTNNTGATIASDTLTVWVFGHKAQVSNPTTNPVAQQPSSGAFATLFGLLVGSVGDATTQIFDSGDYATSMHLVVQSGSAIICSLTWGSGGALIHTFYLSAGAPQVIDLGFGGGVANPGVWLDNSGNTSDVELAGYLVVQSSTPPQEVSVVS